MSWKDMTEFDYDQLTPAEQDLYSYGFNCGSKAAWEQARAEATGPERVLADLDMMAKKFDYHPVRQGVYVYWDDGQYIYRQSPMGNHITRAEALELLSEKAGISISRPLTEQGIADVVAWSEQHPPSEKGAKDDAG